MDTIQGHVGPRRGSIEADFKAFHEANPHVYEHLRRLAFVWKARRPGQRLGIGMLFEVARWDISLGTDGDPFKLNNNYRALYARMLMEREPDLRGLFQTRRLTTEQAW